MISTLTAATQFLLEHLPLEGTGSFCTSLSLLKKVGGGEVDTVIPCATGALYAWTLSPILS